MKQNVLIAIVLAILVVVLVVQAVQINSTSKEISGGEVKVTTQATAPAASSGSGGGNALPPNLQNLPNMVGGC